MHATLVFLGRLEDLAGRASQQIDAGASLAWPDILRWLGESHSPDFAETVGGERVKVALNGRLVADKVGVVLSDGDEIAFLPPVSGG